MTIRVYEIGNVHDIPSLDIFARGLLTAKVCSESITMPVNTLRPRQNGRLSPDDIFKWIFLNENLWISNKISLKFVPKGQINNIPALVQIMAWCRSGDKPLSETMMVSLLTHIYATRPQWINICRNKEAWKCQCLKWLYCFVSYLKHY